MRFVVFSGTADGRALCKWLSEQGAEVTACVATEYGAELMHGGEVHTGRMDESGMRDFLKKDDIVIDATHPYAAEVSENIFSACAVKNIRYLRMVREETSCPHAIYVDSVSGAAEYLSEKDGEVFVSTGSKELHEFQRIGCRVRARVLDVPGAREKCNGLGIAKVIYKAPPFSYEDNLRDFKGCRCLVTKDGGRPGGMAEKLHAAEALGMEVIIVRRPKEQNGGLGYEEMKRQLKPLIMEDADGEVKGGEP